MNLTLRLIATAAAVFLLASCGGGDAGAPPLPTSGRVVEGYLSGATVLCDSNGNGVADAGEVTVTTDAGGNFTFAAPGCAASMTAIGGRDVDTGIDFKGVMKAPAGATVVTPLTTLMVAGMSQERVIAALGLPAGTDIPNANPAFDPELMKRSLAIEQLLIKTTEMFAGLGGDTSDATMQAVYSEVATAYAILLQGGGTLIAGTEMDSILVAQLVKVATQRVAQSPVVGSQVKTALAELNAESLGIATSGGLTAQAEHILQAANDAITAAATASQSDTTITELMIENRDVLKAAPSAATYALGAKVTLQVTSVLTPAQAATLPISFDGATPVPFTGFDGAEGTTVEPGPTGGTGNSLRILRSGGQSYAGAFVTTVPIPFAADMKTFTAKVYSPTAGIRMVLKVEGVNGLSSADFDATTPVVVGWQTLTWVANGVDLSKSYTKITLLPNFGTVDAAPGQSYYFDDINLVKDSVVAGATLPISFDEVPPVSFLGFDGAEGTTIEAGPAGGGTGKSLKILRSGGQVYAGAFIDVAPLPLAANKKTFTARVYSPKAGIRMVLKVEGANGLSSAEFPASSPIVVGWQTVTWVATGLDLGKSYTKITLLPNLGTVDAAPGQSYYFDDITLVADGSAPTDYLALVADTISLVNDETKTDYTMAQFESAAGISVGWPIPSPLKMRVPLKEVGNFTLPAGLKVEAAVSITETTGGKGEIQAYIANVAVTETATGLEIMVPTASPDSLAYTVSTDAKKKMVIDFAGGVKGVSASLTTAADMTNSLNFGEVVQYAINSISGQGFTGIYDLRGKYRVTVVLKNMPLRRSDGSALPNLTVVVPTQLGAGGTVTASKTVTGPGLVGHVTLTNN